MLQPSTSIALWVMLAISLHGMQMAGLMLLTGVVAGLVFVTGCIERAWKGLVRARILLLAMFLIYAFTTPGDAVLPSLGRFSPSLNGLQSGAVQAWRLAIMLASLAVLLSICTRSALLGGLFHLIKPLALFGVNPERIAVRIWLTLYYAENMPPFKISRHLFDTIAQKLSDSATLTVVAPQEIEIETSQPKMIDRLVLGAAFALTCWSLW